MNTADAPDSSEQEDASLDPADWENLRRLAHDAVDQAIDYVRDVRKRPVWLPVPESVKAALSEPLPTGPRDTRAVYGELLERVFPYPAGNVHPLFFGWVHGVGLASGVVPEIMAAAMNANCGGRDHAGIYVERVVVEWCKSIFGFPAGATGLLLSGTSMANLTGLAIARNSSGGEIRQRGLHGLPGRLVAYASAELHSSITKAVEILGLGRESLRAIPVDSDFRMDIAALRASIAADRAAGHQPFCVVGTAGTVNTGAIDDLETLASLCREERLWFHVDGAFGALAVLSEKQRPRLRGIEKADSLAFDFHKWMHVQYDAGCLLVRDGDLHRKAFTLRPAYLQEAGRGLAGGGEWPSDLGPELSRGFRALKVWFALKEHGVERFGRAITMNCRQADRLGRLVAGVPGVQVTSAPSLSIVCFRFRPAGWDDASLDRLNEDVVADLQESGLAVPSTTRIHGALTIRVNITNHRTRDEDLDLLVRALSDAAARRIEGRRS